MPARSSKAHAIPAAASPWRPRSASPAFVRVAIAGLMTCLTGPLFAGTVFIDLVEDGGGAGVITATLSGSLDFTSNGTGSTGGFSNYIVPANGTIGFGPSTGAVLSWTTSGGTPNMAVQSAIPSANSGAIFAPFGTSTSFAQNDLTNFSGDRLFLYTNGMAVGGPYTSGSSLNASATLSGDFQSRGITLGTATTQFTLAGSANTLTVRASVVPEPTTWVMGLAGIACGCWQMSRRRRA